MDIVLNFLWTLAWWFIGLIIHMGMVTVLMVSSVWALLIIYRILGIPWIDGTTKGLVKRE